MARASYKDRNNAVCRSEWQARLKSLGSCVEDLVELDDVFCRIHVAGRKALGSVIRTTVAL